jgi:hypothetical protein
MPMVRISNSEAVEKSISQIYYECKDEDGFLYCKYASENFSG